MSKVLFLPVKPKWSDLIMSGQKTMELRRRLPSEGWGKRCIIYSSSPVCSIVGTVLCSDMGRILHPSDDILAQACIRYPDFLAYFNGANMRGFLQIQEPRPLTRPIALAEMRNRWPWLRPPQSYRFVLESFLAELEAP